MRRQVLSRQSAESYLLPIFLTLILITCSQLLNLIKIRDYFIALPLVAVLIGGGLATLSNVVRENIDVVSKSANLLEVKTNVPDAGSFILIGMKGTRYAYRPMDFAEDILMSARIAVAPSTLFYPAANVSEGFVRISLARPKGEIEYFCRTLESLLCR